jgi:nitrate/nitrite transporter NarK
MLIELNRTYWTILLPAICALFLAYPIKKIGLIPAEHSISLTLIAPLFFVLAVVFAIALPIFTRSIFVHKIKDQKTVSRTELTKFERKLIIISLMPSYIVMFGYILGFSNFYFTGIVLVALYSAYYFYPSKKRIQFEKHLFRVQE